MTLIDTSAWIEFLRKTGDADVKTSVTELVRLGQAALTCPIRYELLSGARKDELKTLELLFEVAHHFPTEPIDWIRAAEIRSVLLKKGKAVPLSDLLIFCVAERNGIPLLEKDAHFEVIGDCLTGS